MKNLTIVTVASLALMAGCASQSGKTTATPAAAKAAAGTLGSVDAEGFTLISDGSWTGWRVNENAKAWSIVDGAFRAQGDRSHNFYYGPLAPFKDFELKIDVKTDPELQRRHLHPHQIPGHRMALGRL